MKRFKACNVRMRRVDGIADAVQQVKGLKRIAAVLRTSGLVHVDQDKRTFDMHQLLQQAVGKELGWRAQCQRMRVLLQARCGRFGDEANIDVGLFGSMREVTAAAFDAVGRLKEEGGEMGDGWYSGMLLRLYDVAREVYGHAFTEEFPNRVLVAAHGSLVADLMREEVVRLGGILVGRRMPLREFVDAVPHLRNIVVYGEFPKEYDLMQLMRDIRGLRVLDNGSGGYCVEFQEDVEAAKLRNSDGGLVVGGQRLRAMLWSFRRGTMKTVQSYEEMMDDIGGVHDGEAEGEGRWEVAVALAKACSNAGRFYFEKKRWKEAIDLFERAHRMHLDTFGEMHPATAVTLENLGAALGIGMGRGHTAIMMYERALRIFKTTLGMHPQTAATMTSLGAAYIEMGQNKKGLELHEQALRIYERTIGRTNHGAAQSISGISREYSKMGNFVKAEQLLLEAAGTLFMTRGFQHEETQDALEGLLLLKKALPQQQIHAETLAMGEQVLEFNRRVRPANHPDIGEGCEGRDGLHAVWLL